MDSETADRNVFAAPWGRALKGASFGLLALFVLIAVWSAVDQQVFLPLLLPFALLLALPFMVRGYTVTEDELIIKRLGWVTRFPLDDFQSVEIMPNAMRGSIRLCGNGGLFSITGLLRNKTLGNFRSFANDLKHTVVLRFEKRIIVVSPDDPETFAAVFEKRRMG